MDGSHVMVSERRRMTKMSSKNCELANSNMTALLRLTSSRLAMSAGLSRLVPVSVAQKPLV